MDFSQIPGLGIKYLTVRLLISLVGAIPHDPDDSPKVSLKRIRKWLPTVKEHLESAEKEVKPLRLELATIVGVSITSKLFSVARYIAAWGGEDDKRILKTWPLIIEDIRAERAKLPPYDEAVAVWESEVAAVWNSRKSEGDDAIDLDTLTDTESILVQSIGDEELSGAKLCKKANLDYQNSKHALANLVARGLFAKGANGRGYRNVRKVRT